ncbi:MAG: pilus assembly protein PilP [Myxococcota bacterium]|nr:pilus assembly protein PilP [Myxococcota bacterium]
MRWTALGLVLGLLLLATGCEEQGANAPTVQEYEQKRAELLKRAKQAGSQVARRPARAAQPGASDDGTGLGSVTGFAYDSEGKRDPFRSFVLEQAERMAKHERGPLEQFDLNQLTVVAVVWGNRRPRALVEDPSGRGYVIQEGTAIGKNDGFVVSIGDDAVLVRETYVDYLGEQTNKEIQMRVRQTQGG